jgi:hypothetical protein
VYSNILLLCMVSYIVYCVSTPICMCVCIVGSKCAAVALRYTSLLRIAAVALRLAGVVVGVWVMRQRGNPPVILLIIWCCRRSEVAICLYRRSY